MLLRVTSSPLQQGRSSSLPLSMLEEAASCTAVQPLPSLTLTPGDHCSHRDQTETLPPLPFPNSLNPKKIDSR